MKIVEREQQAARSSLTIVDRVVGYFNPQAGFERLKGRMMLDAATGVGGYNGGRRERRATKMWRPKAGSANADVLPDLPDLVARARELSRNVPIATGAIATTKTNVVGDGIKLQASIDASVLGISPEAADAMEREQEREWTLFCANADFTRVQHFDEMSELVFGSSLDSGDAFVVRRFRKDAGDVYGTKLQLLEADRVSNPNRGADTTTLAGGVELDKDGVPQAYHVSDHHPGDLRAPVLNWSRIPARTDAGKPVVIHVYDRLRPDLTRGVPYLAPVIEHLKQFGEYTDAEVRAAVLTSYVTWFVKQTVPEDSEDPAKTVLGSRDSSLADDEIKLGSGALVDLGPNEDVTAPSPSRPNPQFDAFTQAFLRQIGVALELPFELLIKHFTASYSASRAALEMAWQFFRKKRKFLSRRLHQTVYEWMMEEAVATGRLNRPGFFEDPVMRMAYLGAEWIGPARASINPKAEAEADEIDCRLGTKTLEQVCIERTGGRWEDKHRQSIKENTMRRDGGLITPDPQPGNQASPADATANGSDAEDEAPQSKKASA